MGSSLRSAPVAWPISGAAKALVMRKAFRNWLWPGLLRRLARGSRLDRRVVMATRSGPTLIARLRDLAAPAEVFGLASYDFDVIEWDQVHTVIDVGAHIGSFTLWVSARTRARVLALEPNPEAFALLAENVRRAGLEDVRLSRRALAGAAGKRRLTVGTASETSTLLGPQDAGLEVEGVTLAGVIGDSGFPLVDLLKIDIEGVESEVFERMEPGVLASVHRVIVECHPRLGGDPAQVLGVLHAAGYQAESEENPASAVTTVVGWR